MSQIGFYNAQYLFAMYMDFFLLYLILKFTRESQEGSKAKASIGFVQKKKIKDIVRTEVHDQENKLYAIRQKQQLREYMYRITPQDNDLKLDKNIASAFMNMRKTTLTDSMFWSNSIRGRSQSEGGTSADRRTWASTTSAEPLFMTLADESNTSIQVDEILEEYEKHIKAR